SLVPVMLAVPAVAAVVCAALGPTRRPVIRQVALAASLVTLALALVVAVSYARAPAAPDASGGGRVTFEPRLTRAWDIYRFGKPEGEAIRFYVGLDGLNVWLVVLTAVLVVPSVLVSWTSVDERANEFYAWLLALETGMLGVFLAFDIILFYVFFEL